jgi:hypothetical protein
VRIVHEPAEDGVGNGGSPMISYRQLASHHGRAAPVGLCVATPTQRTSAGN